MTQHFPTRQLRFFLTAPSPCPYLPDRHERKVFAHLPLSDGASVNDSLLARSMSPALSSVNIFSEVLGRQAFRLLRERMERIYEGPPVRILLEPSLIVRGSTAAPGVKPE